jgi:uncharacterized protein (DUF433 family)
MSTEKEAVEIVTTPDVLHGQPRLDGTRIGVHMLGEMIRDGEWTTDEVVAEYPELSHKHVEAALAYYDDHPEEMAALTEERETLIERLRRESGA